MICDTHGCEMLERRRTRVQSFTCPLCAAEAISDSLGEDLQALRERVARLERLMERLRAGEEKR